MKTIMKTNAATLALLSAVALTTTACTHLDPVRIQEDFGQSHAAMLSGQYYDADVARNPSTTPPSGMDGVKADNILRAYREDVSERDFEDTQESITVLTSGD
jgi:hypothetical protein